MLLATFQNGELEMKQNSQLHQFVAVCYTICEGSLVSQPLGHSEQHQHPSGRVGALRSVVPSVEEILNHVYLEWTLRLFGVERRWMGCRDSPKGGLGHCLLISLRCSEVVLWPLIEL